MAVDLSLPPALFAAIATGDQASQADTLHFQPETNSAPASVAYLDAHALGSAFNGFLAASSSFLNTQSYNDFFGTVSHSAADLHKIVHHLNPADTAQLQLTPTTTPNMQQSVQSVVSDFNSALQHQLVFAHDHLLM